MSAFQKLFKNFLVSNVKRSTCDTFRRTCGRGAVAVLLAQSTSKSEMRINPIQYPDASQLSHQNLIQQACTTTVNSTCSLLTCTLIAFVEIAKLYSKALKDQMSLMEESLMNAENDVLQEELTDLLTVARNNVSAIRKEFMELESLMEYVEKVVTSVTETSFLAGADTACNALSERLYSAKTLVNEQKQLIKNLETELIQLQEAVIKKSSNPDEKMDR